MLFVIAAFVTVVTLPAWAQGPLTSDGFTADPSEPEGFMMTLLYALVGLAGICVVGFKKSGRSHLD